MGELANRLAVLQALFQQYDTDNSGELTPVQLQALHSSLRFGGISLSQVKAAMCYTCMCDDISCELDELFDALQELDRRYFLVQDFRWEFSLLDGDQTDFIREDQAKFLMEAVHGDLFSKRQWEKFLKNRAVPGSGVSFAEIEVDLCNIPSREDIALEQFEEKQEKDERLRKHIEKKLADEKAKAEMMLQLDEDSKKAEATERQKNAEEERRKKDEEDRLKREMENKIKQKKDEELGKKEAEERERREKEQREREEAERQRELEIIEVQQALEAQRELEKKAKELEEKQKRDLEEAKDDEEQAKILAERERLAEEEADKAKQAAKTAKDAKTRQEAEEAEKAAREKAKRERNEKIRKELKVAIKKRDKKMLVKSVGEFKKAKLADVDGDLPKAERILKLSQAKQELEEAMENRDLEGLEKAITFVKKNTFEGDLPHEMIRANKMLISLKRLKRLRDEILNLKQSTVAEIRSYSKPPRVVHQVMIGTYLLLGNKEKSLKDWKGMQALIGKTGKDGLKRRVKEFKLETSIAATADRSKTILEEFDLETVRDVSAGAAIFFAWATATIDEIIEYHKQREAGEVQPGQTGPKTVIKHTTQGGGTLTVNIK